MIHTTHHQFKNNDWEETVTTFSSQETAIAYAMEVLKSATNINPIPEVTIDKNGKTIFVVRSNQYSDYGRDYIITEVK